MKKIIDFFDSSNGYLLISVLLFVLGLIIENGMFYICAGFIFLINGIDKRGWLTRLLFKIIIIYYLFNTIWYESFSFMSIT